MSFNITALNAFRNVNLGGNDAIANLGQEDNVVKNNTYYGGIGKVFRGDATKAENNAIRAELLRSLGNVFGLSGMSEKDGKVTFSKDFMDKLESYLGSAFKREDFGVGDDGTVSSGKPLTQRRIQAVERAVVSVSGLVDNAIAAAKTAATFPYGLVKDINYGTLDDLIESAMKAAGGDEALIGLLQKKAVIEPILVGGGSRIRAKEDVLKMVAALKANVDELRAATKGNQAIFKAGLRGLVELKGKAFTRGCITAIVREASAVKIGAMRKLSGLSNVEQIHKAVVEYHKHTLDIMMKTDALSSFKSRGAEEYAMARGFVGNLLLGRCTTAQLRGMYDALRSVSAGKTCQCYYLIGCGNYAKGDMDGQKIQAITSASDHVSSTMLDLSVTVSDVLGLEQFDIINYEGPTDDEMTGADIMSDLVYFADQELAEHDANDLE